MGGCLVCDKKLVSGQMAFCSLACYNCFRDWQKEKSEELPKFAEKNLEAYIKEEEEKNAQQAAE